MSCECCARAFLISVNILFVIIGLAFTVVGCLLRFGALDLLNGYLQTLLEATGGSSGTDVQVNSLVGSFSVGLIITGVIILFIGGCGMFGACCKVTWMLIVYAAVIILVLVGQLVGIILLFTLTGQLETFLKDFLKTSLKNDYAGTNSTSVFSLSWNYVFVEFKCCGVENYTDTHDATKWRRNHNISGTPVTLETPLACCIVTGTFPDYDPPGNEYCAVAPLQSSNSNYDKPCYDEIKKLIFSFSSYIIGIGVAILVLQLLLIISAIYLCQRIKKSKAVHPAQY